ncbi:conserved hypothetical protein [Mesorhizobium delmotii]|uniref:Uncharacterized protein n=1 Tax=Mesorhizobium delmotii TaxID=1631247 RepID=A0A2P9ATW2_9HYPH|nr:conserved hypothetical protein [Mesorhizobium delmotii]
MHCVTVSGACETSNVVALQWQLAFMVMNASSRLPAARAARQHKETLLTTVYQQTRLPASDAWRASIFLMHVVIPKPLRTIGSGSGSGPWGKLLGDIH